MKEGWHDDDYFALYESQEEAIAATARYGLSKYLPGYVAVGLKGWDDFILCDTDARYYTVPTVPLSKEEIRPYAFPAETLKLKSDERFEKKIKWYITPIVFGGSLTEKENVVWITHEEHAEFVRWWNKTYFEIKNKTAESGSRGGCPPRPPHHSAYGSVPGGSDLITSPPTPSSATGNERRFLARLDRSLAPPLATAPAVKPAQAPTPAERPPRSPRSRSVRSFVRA